MSDKTPEQNLQDLQQRLANTEDQHRQNAAAKRHGKGYRTARENLADLIDAGSWNEYGQLAVAAQRNRRDYAELQTETAADGIITGTATINADVLGIKNTQTAVMICDYAVLAGTQGYYHHLKLDRLCEIAEAQKLPVVIFCEGGGGRPGDTDIATGVSGLNVKAFMYWARLSGVVPRIAIANGYCFAGNAALFGCADITIATRQSWIGMAGPAMIEGGGLGKVEATAIGPIEMQEKNGVVDIVVADEAEATAVAKKLLGYFQGDLPQWQCGDQLQLRDALPEDRRYGYSVRKIIELVADTGTFVELQRIYGRAIITGFIRIAGKPMGLICNDCQQMGGAIDSTASEKAARFLQLCDAFQLPVLSLTDTPGYMVGLPSEAEAAVRRMSTLLIAGAKLKVPMVNIVLRKAYGLGAIAMAGGSFVKPVYTASWPSGEFGSMGLEGAVKLGYKKELEAIADEKERQQLFDSLLQRMIELGRATESASFLEIDAVIDPADTRDVILRAFASASA